MSPCAAIAPAGLRLNRYVLGQVARQPLAPMVTGETGSLTGGDRCELVGGFSGTSASSRARLPMIARNHPELLGSWLAASAASGAVVPISRVSLERGQMAPTARNIGAVETVTPLV